MVSISVRVWIGIQKMFAMPGVLRLAFISASSLSQVIPCAPLLGRFQASTTVSTIESGAGSVGVSAWPALPKTRHHFRELLCSMRSWICSIFVASAIDMPGIAVGM